MTSRKIQIEGITVVKLGLNKRCRNSTGSIEIKSGADSSKIAKVIATRS